MTRPADDPELSEHLRREFARRTEDALETAASKAVGESDHRARESRRRHEAALLAALAEYRRTWDSMEAPTAYGQGC